MKRIVLAILLFTSITTKAQLYQYLSTEGQTAFARGPLRVGGVLYFPTGSTLPTPPSTLLNNPALIVVGEKVYRWSPSSDSWVDITGFSGTWGSITGTLSAQTDLVAALAAKQNALPIGTSAQYYRGDQTLGTFATDVKSAGDLLYATLDSGAARRADINNIKGRVYSSIFVTGAQFKSVYGVDLYGVTKLLYTYQDLTGDTTDLASGGSGIDTIYSSTTGISYTKLGSAYNIPLVTSFNGRTGAVIPQSADYLAYYATIGHTHTFAELNSKPTTLAGYGITDGVTSARFLDSLQDHWAAIMSKGTGTGTVDTFQLATRLWLYKVADSLRNANPITASHGLVKVGNDIRMGGDMLNDIILNTFSNSFLLNRNDTGSMEMYISGAGEPLLVGRNQTANAVGLQLAGYGYGQYAPDGGYGIIDLYADGYGGRAVTADEKVFNIRTGDGNGGNALGGIISAYGDGRVNMRYLPLGDTTIAKPIGISATGFLYRLPNWTGYDADTSSGGGGGGTTYTFIGSSLLNTDNNLTLKGDVAAPGNNKLYGTNSEGEHGYQSATSYFGTFTTGQVPVWSGTLGGFVPGSGGGGGGISGATSAYIAADGLHIVHNGFNKRFVPIDSVAVEEEEEPDPEAQVLTWAYKDNTTEANNGIVTTATSGNSFAQSTETFVVGDILQFQEGNGSNSFNRDRMMGFSTITSPTSFPNIQYGVYLYSDGNVYSAQGGTYAPIGTYAANDYFRIEYVNSTTLRISKSSNGTTWTELLTTTVTGGATYYTLAGFGPNDGGASGAGAFKNVTKQ